jgi:hypothetical protein
VGGEETRKVPHQVCRYNFPSSNRTTKMSSKRPRSDPNWEFADSLLQQREQWMSLSAQLHDPVLKGLHARVPGEHNAFKACVSETLVAQKKFGMQVYEKSENHFLLFVSEPMQEGPFQNYRLVLYCGTGIWSGLMGTVLEAALSAKWGNTLIFLQFRSPTDMAIEKLAHSDYITQGKHRRGQRQDALLKELVSDRCLSLPCCPS